MSLALDDLLVVDLTTELWSGLAAAMLADFGAEVIRVDIAGSKPVGHSERRAHAHMDEGTWDYEAELVHRNKKSLAVDFEHAQARTIVAALIDKADIVVTDFPMERLQAWGLDYDTVAERNAGLIYARGSGFGPEGPDATLPAIDELAAARAGMMPILQQPGLPPVYPGHGMMYTTFMLCFGVATALEHRRKTGQGQAVDASLLGGNMYGASLDLQAFLAMGGQRFLEPVSRLDAGNPMSGTMYQSQDGLWVTLTMPDTDRWWPEFSQLVGIAVDDPRFATHEDRCEKNRLELMQVLEAAFVRQPASHWRQVFNEKQLSADIIEDYDYPTDDVSARRNRYIVDMDHPSLGKVSTLGFPIFMSDTPARLRSLAPARGQHTAEVLHEHLELGEDNITALTDDGTVT